MILISTASVLSVGPKLSSSPSLFSLAGLSYAGSRFSHMDDSISKVLVLVI